MYKWNNIYGTSPISYLFSEKQKVSKSSWILLCIFLVIIALQGFIELFLYTGDISAYGIYYRPVHYALYIFIFLTINKALRRVIDINNYRGLPPILYVLGIFISDVCFGAYFGNIAKNPFWYSDSIVIFEMIITIPVVYMVVGDVSDVRKSIHPFMQLTTILSLFQVLYYILKARFDYSQNSVGFFTLILLLGLYICLSRVIVSDNIRIRDIITLIIFFCGCLISFHKPVIISFISGIIFMLIQTSINRHKHFALRRLFFMIICFYVILVLVDVFFGNIILNFYSDIFRDSYLHESTGDISGGRYYLWETAWNLFLAKPLLGQGLGVGIGLESGIIIIHNIYLYFLVSFGIVGSFIVFFILLSLFKVFWKIRNIQKDYDIALAIGAYVFSILVYNSFGMMLFFVPVVYLFSISVGILLKMNFIRD